MIHSVIHLAARTPLLLQLSVRFLCFDKQSSMMSKLCITVTSEQEIFRFTQDDTSELRDPGQDD